MKHNLIIECAPASSEDLRRQWEAVVEGVVEYNAEWFSDNMDKVDGPLPKYEEPRTAGSLADQRVATAPVIHARNKATCVEWCAYVAGLIRCKDGEKDCQVLLVPVFSPKYDKEIPYTYHAVIQRADGSIEDVTTDLPGYMGMYEAQSDSQEWWANIGHCCEDCALGIDGAASTCEPCAENQEIQHAHYNEMMQERYF